MTLGFPLTSVRMAIIRKQTKEKLMRLRWVGRTLIHCWWKFKSVQPQWKSVWKFLKKLKRELPYD
jgi:hypothetical protein